MLKESQSSLLHWCMWWQLTPLNCFYVYRQVELFIIVPTFLVKLWFIYPCSVFVSYVKYYAAIRKSMCTEKVFLYNTIFVSVCHFMFNNHVLHEILIKAIYPFGIVGNFHAHNKWMVSIRILLCRSFIWGR